MGKTQRLPDLRFDVASAMSQGQREYQEDALANEFPKGHSLGLSVLADGMGGHVAGDVASRIAVSEVVADLKGRLANVNEFRSDIPGALRTAVDIANRSLGQHCATHPQAAGMGATVVALVLDGGSLYWISVGDSPLYLYRDGALQQLNEDHSLAPQIDYLVAHGMMDPEVGRTHPDRHCLTSVLIGGDIERIDCIEAPFTLNPGDLVLVASDGLQSLDDTRIADILEDLDDAPSHEIAEALIAAVEDNGDPDQDNVSVTVIRAERVMGSLRGRAAVRTAARAAKRDLQDAERAMPGVLSRLRDSLGFLLRRKRSEEGSTP